MLRKIIRYLSAVGHFLFRVTPARAAVASFLSAILMGAVLLSLPISSAEGHWTSPVDALFTATSGVCVTGLIVKDTPVYWSFFGEMVVLLLIQVGGLGIMTLYALLATMLMRRIPLRFEGIMSDIVEAEDGDNIWSLVKFICKLTLCAELIGAVGLYLVWKGQFESTWQCVYFSIFHAISAFCNAGFSLFSDSLLRFRGSIGVNAIVGLLIVTGGIGFIVIRDLKSYLKRKISRRRGRLASLSTHSKLALTVTAVLLALGFVGIFIIEPTASLKDAPMKDRLLAAMFQSVTARTAGFNTVKLGASSMAASTAFMLMALMFIGGSPGSTAGGIKTTTVGVIVASIAATLKGRSKAEIFHHSVRSETVHRVASIILLSLAALATAIFVLLRTETGFSFIEIAFEATSAFGTVGLSLGITSHLTAWGKLVITVLMFVGRLGPITLLMSVAWLEDKTRYSYPHAFVMVG